MLELSKFTASWRNNASWCGKNVYQNDTAHHVVQSLERQKHKKWCFVALYSGIIASVAAIIFPLLPIKMHDISFGWPNQGVVENINAPLVSLVPEEISATVPCDAATDLAGSDGLLLSTMPKVTISALSVGLFIRTVDHRISVNDRGVELASVDLAQALASHCIIHVLSNYRHTQVRFIGYPKIVGFNVADPILRPQAVGLYTDVTAHKSVLKAHVKVDTRWESSPSILKVLDGLGGILFLLISLFALYIMDKSDGRKLPRFPILWGKLTSVDCFVIAILGVWDFLGANTSDDGYQFTMARLSGPAGYMVNFFRWWGASEDPFGWHYNILRLLTEINPSAWFMRLLSVLMSVLCWILISREVLPRLGRTVRDLSAVKWSAALGLLIIWLPFNNGLRPEPEVTLSTLLVWCLLERSIATARVLPVALAVMLSAFTVGEAPGGIMSIAVLLVCSSAILVRTRFRWKSDGILPLIMPIIAAGLSFLFVGFADQPLGVVLDGVRAKTMAGPSYHWWDEPVRFFYLMRDFDVNGAQNRRIGVLVTFVCLMVITVALARKRHPAGMALGPAWRLVGIMLGILCAMMLTPTKWTHHFGVYAAFTAVLAGLATALIYPSVIANPAKRIYFKAALVFTLAASFGGINGWWFVASYGIPWRDSIPHIGGISFRTILLLIAILLAAYGFLVHMRLVAYPSRSASHAIPVDSSSQVMRDAAYLSKITLVRSTETPASEKKGRLSLQAYSQLWTKILAAPIALVLFIAIAFEISSFAYAAWTEKRGFTWLSSNIADITGHPCALADKILVEADINHSFLQPLDPISPQAALLGSNSYNFHNLLPDNLQSEQLPTAPKITYSLSVDGAKTPVNLPDLPYGMLSNTPFASSYGQFGSAALTSAWYRLPPRTKDTPLITLSAAGMINAQLMDLKKTDGGNLVLEIAQDQLGKITSLGILHPLDSGPNSLWRNLRYPTRDIPYSANLVRIVANEANINPTNWLAFTPPRMSHMVTAEQFLGTQPGLIDWLTAFAFPCQREIKVHNGMTQIPHYRIMPDYTAARTNTNTWQNGRFGGPLGNTDYMLKATSIPTYLENNWDMDWGNIQLYKPIKSGSHPVLHITPIYHWGWWKPVPIRSEGL